MNLPRPAHCFRLPDQPLLKVRIYSGVAAFGPWASGPESAESVKGVSCRRQSRVRFQPPSNLRQRPLKEM